MRIKERQKYLQSHYEIIKNMKMPDRTERFNLDDTSIESIHDFGKRCSKVIGLDWVNLPHDFIKEFLDKNQIFFDKISK